MADLIDRQALIDTVRAIEGEIPMDSSHDRGVARRVLLDVIPKIMEAIRTAPTVDQEDDMVDTLTDSLSRRQHQFEWSLAVGWCENYQNDKETSFTPEQSQAFCEGMMYANQTIYDDLIDIIQGGGIVF